ncbi:MAG: T9SS type A sorting domain-containing protein [Bacteroidia bacterium]|jgi:hypothetical protein
MRKLLLQLSLVLSITSGKSLAQAELPAFYACEGNTPLGFTLDLGTDSLYAPTSACEGQASLRFASESENLIIHTASQPTSINFLAKGMVGTADFWNGSFHIEESTDGQNWTVIDSISGQASLPIDSCVEKSFPITNPETRYLRLNFFNKFSGNDTINGGGNVNIDSIYVDGSTITSLLENSNKTNKVRLFPNPSESIFNLSSTSAMNRIRIFDAVGMLILDTQLPNVLDYSLSLEQLTGGIYWIEVSGSGTRSTHKTIKL